VHRIVDAGIQRVVASIEDPNPAVQGRGFEYLRAHGVTVEIGPGREQSTRLNQPFLTLMREHRPFVILKAATSIDGCIAEAPATRTSLTSAAANRHAQAFRAEVDAIGVGVGTVLADDPLLTVRGIYRQRPLTRVVFDRRLRTPSHARLFSTLEAGPVIIVTTTAAAPADIRRLEARGAQIDVAAGDSFRSALDRLGALEIGSLLLEGGAAMHAAAWDERLVDFVRLYVTPVALGGGGVPFLEHREFSTSGLAERRVEALGADVLIEGYVHRPH
jgi:diaminohydroxyphosphoribosylaminopyrimidine deaminase/5-amino-6-(5-phosphoribosylamino)uracil reductase